MTDPASGASRKLGIKPKRMAASKTEIFARAAPSNGWALRFMDPTLPIWLGVTALLVFLMVLPLAAIFRTSLWGDGGVTFSKYLEVFTDEQSLKAIWNSLIISTWVGLISVMVGALLAWLVTRTDLPWKLFVEVRGA